MIRTIKILAITFIILLGINTKTNAQQLVQDVLKGGANDAEILATDYLSPFGKAFGSVLNQGWYNTAKPHHFPFVDLTLYWNWAMIPAADKNFTFPSLKHIQLQDSTITTSSTIAGSGKTPNVKLVVTNPLNGHDTTISKFNLPAGLGVSMMSLPIPQLTIGLVKGTDLSIRYLPTLNIPGAIDAKASIWGVGIKHEITQYMKFVDKAPIDISIQGAYSQFKSELGLNMQPQASAIPTNADYTTQKLQFDVTAYTINLLVSKKLLMFTFYGSAGYQHSSSTMSFVGNYPITTINNSGQLAITDLKDPIKVDLSGVNGLKANLGIRYTMLIFTLHADYTFATYPGISAGIGINIDKN